MSSCLCSQPLSAAVETVCGWVPLKAHSFLISGTPTNHKLALAVILFCLACDWVLSPCLFVLLKDLS